MRFAIGLPNVGAYGDPRLLVELGSVAEESGWDGVFIWDHVAYREPGWPVADPQVAVAALAASTKRVRLGVLMVALPRRRPWKVARELASLDVQDVGLTWWVEKLGWFRGSVDDMRRRIRPVRRGGKGATVRRPNPGHRCATPATLRAAALSAACWPFVQATVPAARAGGTDCR